MSSLLPRSGLWSFKQGLNNFLFGTIGNSVLHGNSQLLVALGSSQGTVDWHGRGWKRRDVARCSKLICLSVCFCTGTSLAKEHTRTSHNMKLWNVSSVTELILMLSGNRGEQHQSLSPWVLKLSSHRHNLCLSIQFVFHSTRLSQILFTTCRRSHAKDQSGNCSQLKDTFSMVEFVVCWLCRYASVSQRPAFKPGFRQYQRHALVQQRCSLHGTNPDRWWLGLAWSSSVSRAFDLKLLEQFANTVHWCCLNDERLTSQDWLITFELWIDFIWALSMANYMQTLKLGVLGSFQLQTAEFDPKSKIWTANLCLSRWWVRRRAIRQTGEKCGTTTTSIWKWSQANIVDVLRCDTIGWQDRTSLDILYWYRGAIAQFEDSQPLQWNDSERRQRCQVLLDATILFPWQVDPLQALESGRIDDA